MFQHQPHQGHNNLLSPRTAFPSERQLFLQRGNTAGEPGLVLSTDAKPRLKWNPELHERFVEAVNQLGGADSKYTKFHIYNVVKTVCFTCSYWMYTSSRENIRGQWIIDEHSSPNKQVRKQQMQL
ncbi:hypothetical protein B296_00002022 [Ensete ventricosum]|uniref:Myb-like domain-containing protein n=1 Tax=Ensete ventricosum TaxID=4639 RepID=A0A427B1V5_ENSVE|nr:hypothetical protein B296_00002022 [Ensete ventricosum]